jgi:hypothetical protein
MILSRLNEEVLRRIVALFVNRTGIRPKEGAFQYTVRDITRELTFGGDFTYRFGDLFKLVFVRDGMKRSEEDSGKYHILFHLEVELDNAIGLRKDDNLHRARRKIADETEDRLEEYLTESGLAIGS